jgi:hypothetical protein
VPPVDVEVVPPVDVVLEESVAAALVTVDPVVDVFVVDVPVVGEVVVGVWACTR